MFQESEYFSTYENSISSLQVVIENCFCKHQYKYQNTSAILCRAMFLTLPLCLNSMLTVYYWKWMGKMVIK